MHVVIPYKLLYKVKNDVLKNKNMKKINKAIYLIFTLIFLIPSMGLAQDMEESDSLNNKVLIVAREIMTNTKTSALITLDDEGRPRVRAMDSFLPESDFTVWFGTNPKSRKVEQIKKDPRVTLYYLESNNSGYVMIHGKAQIVNDPKEKEKRWKDEWEAFYPNKSEDYILIRVTPEWMEVSSYAYGLQGDPITWEPSSVKFKSK
jgi:general stress protein 26